MLFTYEAVQPRLNIDLSSPNGQELATTLITAVQAFASQVLDFPIESAQVVEYFEEGQNRLWLNTGAPVSSLTIATYNNVEAAFEDVDSQYVRNAGDHNVNVSLSLPSGFQSVRATYTTGCTSATIPAELKDALIELVGLKIQEVTNFSSNPDDPAGDDSGPTTGALKRVEAVDYTEEYFAAGNEAQWKAEAAQLSRTIGDDVPAHILNTITHYRRPFAV